MLSIQGYSVQEILSNGRVATIYRATRESDGKPVILKHLDREFPESLELARFRREFQVLQDLKADGVVEAIALESHKNSLVLVLEDFGGESLKALLEKKKVSLLTKLKIAKTIVKILGQIHQKKVIHKDLTPSNILVNPETGVLKIIDFGIASVISHENLELKNPDHLEGTLPYIAPEQTGRMNRPIDYRADFYTLGITLYELLAGKRPFEASDNMEMVHMHLAVAPEPLHLAQPDVPEAVSKLIHRLIQKNAEDRYQSAMSIKSDLEELIHRINAGESMDDFEPGKKDLSDRFSIPARLYGRDQEVKLLMDTFKEVAEGKARFLLIDGYSGIGKTALVNEVHKPITEYKGYFIHGKFDQYKRNVPYSALIQAFEDLIHQILTESEESIGKWKQRLLSALEENGKIFLDVLPELIHIIGPQKPVAELGPQESKNRFMFYFRNLVQAFTTRPLTIFLDDLQWADLPSLALLELLVTDQDSKNLFVIGAYRDNEVDPTHPLMQMVERIHKLHFEVSRIHLNSLSIGNIAELLQDAFECGEERAHGFADMILKKTGGNPFFISQLLRSLYEAKLISYNYQTNAWDWNLAEIQSQEISENVVDLMIKKISSFESDVQDRLKIASCMGGRFSLYELSVISSTPVGDLAGLLEAAIQEEVLLPLGEEYRLVDQSAEADGKPSDINLELSRKALYRFQHDRVQQAAYSLLDTEAKEKVHYTIGRLMMDSLEKEQIDEKIFDIVNHFNLSSSQFKTPAEQYEVLDLNLRSAIKAKESIAYDSALGYIKQAQALLDPESEKVEGLPFKLAMERAECEHLTGDDGEAEVHFQKALSLAKNENDKGIIYEKMIHFYTNTGNFKAAYESARKAVKLYGVSLPGSFIPPLFLIDLAKSWFRIRGKKIESLIDLPECQDEKKAKAMRLIAAVLKAAYQIRPELSIANAVKAVNLSLKYGQVDDIAIAYLVYGGIFLGSVVGRHSVGYQFGKLALAMNEKYDNVKQKSEINFVSAYFTNFWFNPVKTTEGFYRRAYEAGIQSGDFFHVSCSSCTMVESNYIRGVPFEELEKQSDNYLRLVDRINNREARGAILAVARSIQNLKGLTTSPESFGDETFQEEEYVEEVKTYTSLHFSHFYFINKMQSLYLWKKYEQALEVAKESEKFLKYSVGMLHTVEHHFYHALILLALFHGTRNRKNLSKAKKIKEKIRHWAGENEQNFQHKYLLLEAEISRATSRDGLKTLALYERAFESARSNGFIQNGALIRELTGRFLMEIGNDYTAMNYFRDAVYHFQLWGADGIVEMMHGEFPELQSGIHASSTVDFHTRTIAQTRTGSNTGTGTLLDLDTVMKSAQAISSEIRLGSLLEKLISIIVENAGARRGFFITQKNGRPVIEARMDIASHSVHVEEGLLVDDFDEISRSVVHYVSRTEKPVLLENASESTQFQNDPYIQQSGARSLLCTPVTHKGEIVAIIYLENNLSTNIFTPARLEMIQMLASQAAISLENARHYDELEQKVEERTRDLKEEQEKSEKLLLNILPRDIADELKVKGRVNPDRYESVSIMFTDFKGFTRVASNLPPEKLVEELDHHFSRFDEISDKYGLEKLKTIGDSYMCAGGLPSRNESHAMDICLASLELQNYIAGVNQEKASKGEEVWEVRIGIHSGSVVAGVIGKKKFTYDIWGDTVNVASRMESNSLPGKINISQETYQVVKDYFHCEERGSLDVKNKGQMEMFFLNRIKPEFSSDPEGIYPRDGLREMFLNQNQGQHG